MTRFGCICNRTGILCTITGETRVDDDFLECRVEDAHDNLWRQIINQSKKRTVHTDEESDFWTYGMYDKKIVPLPPCIKVNLYSINEFEDYYGYMLYSTELSKYFLNLYRDMMKVCTSDAEIDKPDCATFFRREQSSSGHEKNL